MMDTKTANYFKETSLNRHVPTARLPSPARISPFKAYPEAEKLSLPKGSWKLHEARIVPLIQHRRSLRKYSLEPLDLDGLSFLLWCSQGFTARAGKHFLRATPSAGALYPVETYILINNVLDVKAGLYHFEPFTYQLELLQEGNINNGFAQAFCNQDFINYGAVTFIWTAMMSRTLSKYGERGGRYLLLDVAHICQNVLIGAEALACGGCPIASFYDDEVSELLSLDSAEELPLYAATVGKKQ